MKQLVIACAAVGLLVSTAWAGVVVETEVKDSDSPGKSNNETFYAQGEMIRMDPHAKGDTSVIFRDQTMWFIDHDKKVCQKIDREGIAELSSQLDAVMKELENLPPEQRAMVEKMMEGKMPAGRKDAPPRRVEVGAAEQVGEYTCTVHTLYSAEERVWEVCTAEESVVDGIAEAMDAFRAMSRFTEELQQVVQQGGLARLVETPYTDIDEMGGFPVRTRMFDKKGEVVRESTLKSVTRQDVDEVVFTIPKGYKVKDLKKEMKKGR